MATYILRRLLLMIPTFLGITVICFFIINLAPGSPIEQKLQALRFSQGAGETATGSVASGNGQSTVSDEVLAALKKQYGFDRPIHIRYLLWLKNILFLNFGDSFVYEAPVVEVIISKFPVSLQFGIISLLLTYLICIPLGVSQALHNGSLFDSITSFLLLLFYSIPPVILAILLIVFLAGGSFFDIMPLGELYSDNYFDLNLWGKFLDRAHHFILPLLCYMIGNFAVLTKLMKDSMLDVVRLDFVRTAKAKGLADNLVYFKHALRNALIPIAAGIGGFLGVFFAGSIIIEQIFQLDGMGLLSYNSILNRDYNVIMGLLFFQSIVLLLGKLISDILYVLIDPRVNFS